MLEGLLRRTRNPAKQAAYSDELAMPPFPSAVGYLWSMYGRLRRRAGSNGWGVSPIGWQEIDAFLRRSGQRLAPWEVEIIEAIDDAYVAQQRAAPTGDRTPSEL